MPKPRSAHRPLSPDNASFTAQIDQALPLGRAGAEAVRHAAVCGVRVVFESVGELRLRGGEPGG
jgi:hypothetical protein